MKNLITVNPKDITFHPRNYNRHSEAHVEELARSLDLFDQYKNIALWSPPEDDTLYVIAGEGLVKAARKRGRDEIEARDMSHLTEEHAMALMLSDNLTPSTDFDGDKVAEIVGLIDRVEEVPGVTPDWLELMLEKEDTEPPENFPEYDESIETQYECPKCGYDWSGSPK